MGKRYVLKDQLPGENIIDFIRRIKKLIAENPDVVYFGEINDDEYDTANYISDDLPSISDNVKYSFFRTRSGRMDEFLLDMKRLGGHYYTVLNAVGVITSDDLRGRESLDDMIKLVESRRASNYRSIDLENEFLENGSIEEKSEPKNDAQTQEDENIKNNKKDGIQLLKHSSRIIDSLTDLEILTILYSLIAHCVDESKEKKEIDIKANDLFSSEELRNFISLVMSKKGKEPKDITFSGMADLINTSDKTSKQIISDKVNALISKILYDYTER